MSTTGAWRSLLEEALADFERAVELGPDDDDTYYNLAIAQYNLDLASEAVYTLMAGLDVFPESVELWELCGDVLYAYGAYAEAVFAYDMAAAHGGFDAQELPYYLDAMEQAGDMAEGMDIAEELPGDVTDALEETAGVPDQTGNHADVPPLPPAK